MTITPKEKRIPAHMANTKDKSADELDAVTAAYESISQKLAELRKKQAASSDEEKEGAVSKSESKEDEDEIEEFDTEDEDDKPKPGKTVSKTEIEDEADSDEEKPLKPLPGTEESEEEAKDAPDKQIYQANDPLDDESEDASSKDEKDDDLDKEDEIEKNPVEAEIQPRTISAMGAQQAQDEMEKWEQMNSGSKTQVEDDPEDEAEIPARPTFTPVSQDDFRASLKRPAAEAEDSEDSDGPLMPERKMPPAPEEPDTLEDLANEPREEVVNPRRSEPTPVDDLEEEWDIRRLKPSHPADSFEQEMSYSDAPNRGLRRPTSTEERESYFDRRNQPLPRKKASIWHLFILILIGIGVIGATVYFLKYQFNEPAKPTPSPEISSPTPLPTPEATPVTTIEDRSHFTVRVLNGTTKTGWAGEILKKLKDAGFKTDRAGNATNSAFQQTVIRVKEGTQSAELINTVTQDLGSELSPISETTLKSNDKADIEVILGQK